MKINKIKKDVNNIELCKIASRNMGLKTETVHSTPTKTLLYITNGKRFFLASSAAPGMFPNATRWYAHFTGSKLLSQTILKRLGYKVIPSKGIHVKDFSSVKKCTQALTGIKMSFPVLLKPDHGMNAKHISIIENQRQLVEIGIKHYKKNGDFLIQPIISGQTEYRIFVVNNKVMLMHSKETYHIKGDGITTIKKLLENIVPERTDATYISWQHKKLGTQPSTVLEKGVKFEYHLTRGASNTFYKTKKFPTTVKKWALQLAKDTSTSVVGIDVFIPDNFQDTSKFTIIELNTNPGLHYLVSSFNDGETGIKIFESVLRHFFKIK